MGFENIVRPFQGGSVFNGRRLPPAVVPARDVPEPAVLSFSCKSSGAYIEAPPPNTGGFTTKQSAYDEVDRTTEKVRIENPNDPEQYVVVERITSLTVKKKIFDSSGNQFQTWDLHWDQSGRQGTPEGGAPVPPVSPPTP